jgi:hypothetical protein
MADSSRFPASCRLVAAVVGTVEAQPPPSNDLGPDHDGCGSPSVFLVGVEMAPAPQPERAVASVWVTRVRSRSLERRESIRDSDEQGVNATPKSAFPGRS